MLFNAKDAVSGLLNVVIVIVVVHIPRVRWNLLIETTTQDLMDHTNKAVTKHLYYLAQLLIMPPIAMM